MSQSLKLNNLTGIDLFAGIGGFRLAMESCGIQCEFTSEWNKEAQAVYQSNFGNAPYGDITKIKEEDIPHHDILCGGFPCQPFTIAGYQLGFNDTRGTLFYDVLRIVKYHKPKAIFLENVRGIVSHDSGRTFRTIVSSLEEAGYNVNYEILNAADYEMPTARIRTYIVGLRKDIETQRFVFPNKSENIAVLKDYLEEDAKTGSYIIKRNDIYITKQYEDIKDKINNRYRKPIRIGHICHGGQGSRIYSPLGVAITLSSCCGGAAAQTGVYLINGQVRKLSPRECANIMGFPQDFIIHSKDQEAYRQFGNSVVVPVVQKIMQNIVGVLI